MPSRFDIMPVRERCALLSSTSNVLRFLLIAWFLLPNYVSSAEFANCNSTGTQLEMTACAVVLLIVQGKVNTGKNSAAPAVSRQRTASRRMSLITNPRSRD